MLVLLASSDFEKKKDYINSAGSLHASFIVEVTSLFTVSGCSGFYVFFTTTMVPVLLFIVLHWEDIPG